MIEFKQIIARGTRLTDCKNQKIQHMTAATSWRFDGRPFSALCNLFKRRCSPPSAHCFR